MASTSNELTTLNLPVLSEYLQNDKAFISCYARTLCAIAASDKSVSIADFAALMEVARQAQHPALTGMTMLQALEQQIPLETCLNDLAAAASSIEECKAALSMAMPILQLQGQLARPLARKLSSALQTELDASDLYKLPAEAESKLMNQLATRARQLLKGRDQFDNLLDFGKDMGDAELIQQTRACQKGELSEATLISNFKQSLARTRQDINQYRHNLTELPPADHAPQHAAQQLQQQIEQRLAMIAARIRHERACFAEDIEDLVHDAGNAIETAISQRLQTDAWRDSDVWANIANSQFGLQAERRIERSIRRREEVLRLFKEELRLFQADLQLAQISLEGRQHHTALAKLMPPLRLSTRVLNATDSAANLTLGAGTLAVAGGGAAAYLLGSAVVLPLVAPVVPFLAGAMAAAGLFKWFTDSDKRKISEIQTKRQAIEEIVRTRLNQAANSFEQQLTQVEQAFQQSAHSLLGPVVMDAQAQILVQEMHARVAQRILHATEEKMRQLESTLDA